jgi:hypothetical protein
VVANVVTAECRDNILAPAIFQYTSQLTNNLEGPFHPLGGKEVRQAQGGVVAGREDEILRIKPENDINWDCTGLTACFVTRPRWNRDEK